MNSVDFEGSYMSTSFLYKRYLAGKNLAKFTWSCGYIQF